MNTSLPSPGVLALIGNTPLLQVTRLDTGPCTLFLKLESQNPGGSIKDRIAVAMIDGAEKRGELTPGGTIIEATAGNTGLGLALVGRLRGYRILLVVPDKMAVEKIQQLKALGAQVRITRSDVGKGHPEYYQDLARRLATETPGAFFANQFQNMDNPRAHIETTGPEIWTQVEHRLDAIVVGCGSSGTLTGLTHYFREVAPQVEFILADPKGSILGDLIRTGTHGPAGSWKVEGIGEDFVPAIADLSGVRHAYTIEDAESFAMARTLFLAEGIAGGSSTGTLLAAALAYCRAQTQPKRVVSFVCDTGTRYLSKVYNDQWMRDQELLTRTLYGDLRDLIARPVEEGGLITVRSTDTLLMALNRMRSTDVSLLPVMEGDRLVGVLDEADLLTHLQSTPTRFKDTIDTAMTADVQTLAPSEPLPRLRAVLDSGRVAVIADGSKFYGLVTRIDLLNHLRRSLS